MAYLGFDPRVGNFVKLDSISSGFNSSTTAFNLTNAGTSVSAGSANALIVSLNGVIQEPGIDFYISGSQIIFTTAPVTNSTCFIVMLGRTMDVGSVSDGAITKIKLGGDVQLQDTIIVSVSGTTQTATAGNHYVLTNVATTTLTLPASPVSGDIIWVTPTNGLSTNIIARNGNKIMGLSEDMIIDNPDCTIRLRYINSTVGWRIV